MKNVYKISKKFENKNRPFGWGINYQNVSPDIILSDNPITILALEKSHYYLLPLLQERIDNGYRTTLITHDTVELKKEALDWVRKNQDKSNFNLIAIRENIRQYLAEEQGITRCKFLLHPFYKFDKDKIGEDKNHKWPVSISRVDFDKHTEILIEANKILNKNYCIQIYGKINNIYEHHKLNKLLSEKEIPFSKNYPHYWGALDLSFGQLNMILYNASYSIDMSAINKDGGGTQYTFLESIYKKIPLILNSKWQTTNNNTFEEGKNCYYAKDSTDLVKILENKQNDTESITERAYEIIEKHQVANQLWIEELELKIEEIKNWELAKS